MGFHIGQKVIIDCDDTEYLEDRAVDNGMIGVILDINPIGAFQSRYKSTATLRQSNVPSNLMN